MLAGSVSASKADSTNEAWVESARATAEKAAKSDKVVVAEDGERIRLGNRHVAFAFDKLNYSWNAVWLDGSETAIREASFAVEVDGKTIKPATPHAETATFNDKIGSGTEV